jgi:hypothetical protein
MSETGENNQIEPSKSITASEFYAEGFDQKAYLDSLSQIGRAKFFIKVQEEVKQLPEEEQRRIHEIHRVKFEEIKNKPNKTMNEKFWIGFAKVSEKAKQFTAKLHPKPS